MRRPSSEACRDGHKAALREASSQQAARRTGTIALSKGYWIFSYGTRGTCIGDTGTVQDLNDSFCAIIRFSMIFCRLTIHGRQKWTLLKTSKNIPTAAIGFLKRLTLGAVLESLVP
jgi:hypothetical protein